MSSVSEIDGPGDPSAVDRARSRWQHELAELGGPNTLLWFDVQADTVLDLTHAHPGGVAMLLAGRDTRLSDLVREPDALDAAGRRARHVRDAADDALDATGIRSCFLVLGLASWTIPGSERHPVAPVLLRRCTLRPVVAGGRDHVLDLSDIVEINPVLVGYLRSQAGLSIDPDDIVDRAHDRSGFNPALVWERLRRECAGLPDLVVEPSLAVAVVPYGKADRVADVTDPAVPLERSDLLAAAAGDETARERLLARRDGLADEADKAGITDDAEPSVLELDPQQHAAATLVDDGADLAVRAPVGTGASSLVADVVARAAGAGRTVLLVSESGAAIRAVGRRLAGVGLDDALLHLDDPAGAFDARTFIERWSDVEVPDRKALAAIERYHVTHAQWVPTHFVRMLKLPEETRAKYDISSLQSVFHAAAPCPVEIKRAMIDWLGPVIYEYYSATEAYLIEDGRITAPVKGATLIGNGPETMQKVKMVGHDLALDQGVGICGKDGQSVPVGVGQPSLLIEGLTVGGTKA